MELRGEVVSRKVSRQVHERHDDDAVPSFYLSLQEISKYRRVVVMRGHRCGDERTELW